VPWRLRYAPALINDDLHNNISVNSIDEILENTNDYYGNSLTQYIHRDHPPLNQTIMKRLADVTVSVKRLKK
jgi:hypothetical protein